MARDRSKPGDEAGSEPKQRAYSPRQTAGPEPAGAAIPKPLWWDAYFAALAQTGNQTLSARAARIDRSTPRKYLAEHPELQPEFDAAMAGAYDASVDNLEAVARQRATIGWSEPVIHAGRAAWTVCPGSHLPGRQDGSATPCPYCQITFEQAKGGTLPEHPMLDDKGQPKPLTVQKFDNTLLMFLHNVSHRGKAAKGRDDKNVDPMTIARQVREALDEIERIMDPAEPAD
jgi:hypothetical protein